MHTLFISTYNALITICLLKDDKIIEKKVQKSINSHSVHTMPMIKEILETNNLTTKDLNQIEVVNGPGSFTGVRLGVTIAKTLSYTLSIPIKTISSLHAIALSSNSTKKLVTLRDIKGVYYGLFDDENTLLEPLNYLNNKEFNEFIEANDYQNILVEGVEELDVLKIHEYLKKAKPTTHHHLNPLYIKKIEVEK